MYRGHSISSFHFGIFVYYVCRRHINLASLWDICALRLQETINLPGILASLWDICVLCMQETINLPGIQRHFGIFVYYVCRRQSISRESSVTLGYLCITYVGDPQSPGYLASLWDIFNVQTLNLPYSVTLGYLCITYVGDNQSHGYLASLWDICVLRMQETQSISRVPSVTLGYLCITYVGDPSISGTQRHFEIFVYYVCRIPSVTLGYLCICMQETHQSPGYLASLWIFVYCVYYVCRSITYVGGTISRVPSVTLGYLCIMYAGVNLPTQRHFGIFVYYVCRRPNQSHGYLASLWDICVLCMKETLKRRHSISRIPSVTLGYLCIMYVGDTQSPG